MKLRKCLIAICLVLLAAILVQSRVSGSGTREMEADTVGEPVIRVREDPIVGGDIGQVVADGENLYVSFHQGCLVQAYSLDGTYRYSIGVYSHQNGIGAMAAQDGKLYLADKQNNLYVFQDGSLLEFLDRETAWEQIKALGLNDWPRVWTEGYHTEGASLWYGDQCIVARTRWQEQYYGEELFMLASLFSMVAVVLLNLPKKKGSENNETADSV